jgi:hypothetical protein
MQKEMSRKEFLATAGFGVASLFGMGTLLRLLGHNPPHALRNTTNSFNYGGGYVWWS